MTRARAGSTAGDIQAFSDARTRVELPLGVTVPKAIRVLYDQVTSNKAYSLWTPHDRVIALEIAQATYRLNQVNAEILKLNLPSFDDERQKQERLADTLAKRVRMLGAGIAINSIATNGSSEKQTAKNVAAQRINNALDAIGNDPLIARPDSSLIAGLDDYRNRNQ